MKITIQLDDEVYDEALKTHKTKAGVEKAILKGFDLLKGIAPDDRYFVVAGDERRELEKVVQTTLSSSKDVLRHLSNMSKLKIGSVERLFTADELVRLHTQAQFHGWTSEKYLALTSDEALRYVLDRI